MNKLEKAKNYVKEHKAKIISDTIRYGLCTIVLVGYFEWGYKSGIKDTAKALAEDINEFAADNGLPLLNPKVTGNIFKGFTLRYTK